MIEACFVISLVSCRGQRAVIGLGDFEGLDVAWTKGSVLPDWV